MSRCIFFVLFSCQRPILIARHYVPIKEIAMAIENVENQAKGAVETVENQATGAVENAENKAKGAVQAGAEAVNSAIDTAAI